MHSQYGYQSCLEARLSTTLKCPTSLLLAKQSERGGRHLGEESCHLATLPPRGGISNATVLGGAMSIRTAPGSTTWLRAADRHRLVQRIPDTEVALQ